MTREEARKAAEVMIAFVNGEKIEMYNGYTDKWEEVGDNCTFNWFRNVYRVKPKEKFDPKTLQPFDKVLIRDSKLQKWSCDLFSYIGNEEGYPYICMISAYNMVIPYNDETKHLVGTSDEAPEYYKYWEE